MGGGGSHNQSANLEDLTPIQPDSPLRQSFWLGYRVLSAKSALDQPSSVIAGLCNPHASAAHLDGLDAADDVPQRALQHTACEVKVPWLARDGCSKPWQQLVA